VMESETKECACLEQPDLGDLEVAHRDLGNGNGKDDDDHDHDERERKKRRS
jgi:hypothetical protein